MKNDNEALIAEARSFFSWPDESRADELGNNLADALEAADARNAVEYQRGHDRAEHRYKSAIANYKLVAETFEAEHDAALAVIERAPHTIACRSASGMLADRCNCWKANPYRANPEPKEGEG